MADSIPQTHQTKLYFKKLSIKHNRDQDKYLSVYAYNNINTPTFRISYDEDYDSYCVLFTGLWARIDLDYDYFFSLRENVLINKVENKLQKRISVDKDMKIVNDVVMEMLSDIIMVIDGFLLDVVPSVGKNFSMIGFWEGIKYTLKKGQWRCLDLIQDCFNVDPSDAEIDVLFKYRFQLNINYNIDIYTGLLIYPQTSKYYDNIVKYKIDYHFNVIRIFERKCVFWFDDMNITKDEILYLAAKMEDRYIMGFHTEGSLVRKHLFIFKDLESLMFGTIYNVYRNWKMLFNIQVQGETIISRHSYCYGGTFTGGFMTYLRFLSTCTYPLNFNVIKMCSASEIKKICQNLYDGLGFKSSMFGVENEINFGLPMVGEYMGSLDILKVNYKVVSWKNVINILEGLHYGDSIATPMELCTLPNPKKMLSINRPLYPYPEGIKIDDAYSWTIIPEMLFNGFLLSLPGVTTIDADLEFGQLISDPSTSLVHYRKSWQDWRRKTNKVRVNGQSVNRNNIVRLLKLTPEVDLHDKTKVNYPELADIPFMGDCISKHLSRKDVDIVWNNSTIKVLSVVRQCLNLLPPSSHPFTIQFFGVIDEPVQEILKDLDMLKVYPGIGAQAVGRSNFRSDLEQLLYSKSPHIILSDIDQSEAVTEDEIGELCFEQFHQLCSYCQIVCAYKIQYVTPRVLRVLSDRLAEYRWSFDACYFFKPNASGPCSGAKLSGGNMCH